MNTNKYQFNAGDYVQQLQIIAYLEQTLKEIGLCVGCELIYDDNTNIIGCEVSIIGKPNRKIRIDKSKDFFIER